MWMALGADPVVANQIMEMVMEKLAVMAPYVDKKESMMRGGMTKVATNQPLAVSHEHSDLSLRFCQGCNIPLKAYLFLLLLEHKMAAPKTASHLFHLHKLYGYVLLFADDMWSQRAAIKWSEPGDSGQSLSSALLLSSGQIGGQYRGLGRKTEQQKHFPRSGVRVSPFELVKLK